MKARITDAEALRAVSPAAVAAYLISEGWANLEAYGEHSVVYANKPLADELVVPVTEALGDYASVIGELIWRIARHEGRDELQVYRDLVSADKDVVRVRIAEADSDGSVSVDDGVELVRNSRDLMLSAACAAWSPQRTYRAGKVKQADDFLSRVRLGQTEQGSFVVALLAPVPPQLQPEQAVFWPNFQDEPYERRVTRRLTTGLDAAASGVESLLSGGPDGVFARSVHLGVSANLCDAAASLSQTGDGFEVSVTWARTRPTPHARWVRSFTRAEGEVLRSVARSFRDRQSRPDEVIEGFINKLVRDGADPMAPGEATLKAFIDDGWVSVKATLGGSDYNVAVEAHKKVHPVRLHGDLDRVGQRWQLNSAELIEIELGAGDDD
ncbi:hypothetical protein [Paradevosia shaoguanensis]|uniref:hypothetical protein n=1 Tax=Paradevosia shaoguanensis TaxID=1335043 RepID=UPI001933ECA9|nr:hypothetical protein [Paradevosia shaoguanensis]